MTPAPTVTGSTIAMRRPGRRFPAFRLGPHRDQVAGQRERSAQDGDHDDRARQSAHLLAASSRRHERRHRARPFRLVRRGPGAAQGAVDRQPGERPVPFGARQRRLHVQLACATRPESRRSFQRPIAYLSDCSSTSARASSSPGREEGVTPVFVPHPGQGRLHLVDGRHDGAPVGGGNLVEAGLGKRDVALPAGRRRTPATAGSRRGW